MKLSILIPSRQEEFLQQTIDDINKHKETDLEILVGIDDKPIGQRAMTNELARKAKGDYLLKCDAHVSFSQGFDRELLKVMNQATVAVPALCNLYAYDWICAQGHRKPNEQFENYDKCEQCGDEVKKQIVWQPIPRPIMSNYYFDTNLHFQYHPVQQEEEITETMTIQGSCFVISKENYWDLEVCDEKFGSWGQQGVEVACKTWLSGGRVITTRNAFYAHLFRTFPYNNLTQDILKTQQHSKDIFLNNKWPKQKYPLSWLIDKFKSLPDWHEESGKEKLEYQFESGLKWKKQFIKS